jgi:hypothetical protein
VYVKEKEEEEKERIAGGGDYRFVGKKRFPGGRIDELWFAVFAQGVMNRQVRRVRAGQARQG